jgi:NAD(P)-dependent dehydrogenase (short-subunit alcohol dehydrogenase family)
MEELEGRVCVVTGGASGIGLALARRFRDAGMRIAIGDIEANALADAVESLGGVDEVLGVRCDVTSLADVHALKDQVVHRYGAVDLVCLNAGVAPVGPLLETSVDTWKWVLEVNVLGVVHGVDAFARLLTAQGSGHLVLTASAAGLSSSPSLGAYSATKHAVVGLAAVLRDELRASGVGVSVLCPGLVRTRIFESERNHPDEGSNPHSDSRALAYLRDIIGRGVEPPEIAEAVHGAVLEDRLFVIPTSDVTGIITQRLDEVRAALPSA